MSGRVLRVAVATDRPLLAWQARCVESLATVRGVSLERWFQVEPAGAPFRGGGSGALAVAPVPAALRTLQPEEGCLRPGATPATAPPPRGGIDVLLDLTTSGPAVGFAGAAWAREVWRFGYGRRTTRDAARAALVDYVRGAVTRVALVCEPGGTVLREGRLQPFTWWGGERLDHLLFDTAGWPAAVAVARMGARAHPNEGAPSPVDPGESAAAGRLAPIVPSVLLRTAAVGRRLLVRSEDLVRHEEWNIGIVDAPIERFLDPNAPSPITWLGRPGHYAADPFGLERDGVLHVLFEAFDRRRRMGFISHLAVGPDGAVSDPEPVFDPGLHTSYPFLVEHEGGIFMLPETSAARELVLYEAIDFPRRWRRAATLLSGIPAVDASVVEWAGRWWMFATRADTGDNHNLFVWHAPRLTGPWTPHAANPVKTDARSARPAGRPFAVDGVLYRPSQDDTGSYGRRVVVNRVDVLTPASFAERPVRVVCPAAGSPYPNGLHTLSPVGSRTLVDGKVLAFVRDALRSKFAARLGAVSASLGLERLVP